METWPKSGRQHCVGLGFMQPSGAFPKAGVRLVAPKDNQKPEDEGVARPNAVQTRRIFEEIDHVFSPKDVDQNRPQKPMHDALLKNSRPKTTPATKVQSAARHRPHHRLRDQEYFSGAPGYIWGLPKNLRTVGVRMWGIASALPFPFPCIAPTALRT